MALPGGKPGVSAGTKHLNTNARRVVNAGSAVRGACVVAAVAVLAATPARAQGPVELSGSSIPEDQSWKSYVLSDGASDASPVRISSTSGDVTNADGLVDPSKGPATLRYTAGQPAPT